jgi:hypothetical protein
MKRSKTRSNDYSAINDLGLMTALILSILTTVTLVASMCRGQDLPELSPCPSPRPVALEHEGPGIWFERETARCMLGRLAALPFYVERVRLLDQRLTLAEARDGLQERRYAAAVEGEERAVEALEAAVRGQREAEEALDAWHRSPVLWFAVGVVATVGLVVASAYALDRIGGDP